MSRSYIRAEADNGHAGQSVFEAKSGYRFAQGKPVKIEAGTTAQPLFQSDPEPIFDPLRALWRAVGRDQAGFADGRGLGPRDAQAGGFEMRPGLLRAIAAYRADVQPITLGEGVRHAGFDLGRKSRKYGEGGGDKRSNRDGCKSLDHDGPLSLGLGGPFRCLTDTKLRFPDVFAASKTGFVPAEFCFVAG
jgi:hypothetical protein